MALAVFLLVLLTAYGGMQFYFLRKLEAAFPNARRARWAMGTFLVLMLFGPLIVHALAAAGHTGLARWFGAVTYVWSAVVFWHTVLAAAVDIWNTGVRLLQRWSPAAGRGRADPHTAFRRISLAVTVMVVWSFIEADRIAVREAHITSPRLPPGSQPIRLLQVSDLHLSPFTPAPRVARVARLLRALPADLIVATGDLIDDGVRDAAAAARPFEDLKPPLGKYAVLGNHEYYAGLPLAVAFYRQAGFRLLRREAVEVSPWLCIAGVDDPAGLQTGEPGCTDDDALLDGIRPGPYVVLLKHQPRVNPRALDRFDLQLSGHTHGGQIFPFHAFIRLLYPYASGYHALTARSGLYVSRGAGTWGPPLRLFAPPEVTLFVLHPAPAENTLYAVPGNG